jgi:hypothetical protein
MFRSTPPQQGRPGGEPPVLREAAQGDAGGGEAVNPPRQTFPPEVPPGETRPVEQHVKHGHGDGGHQLAEAQRGGVGGKAVGAQRHGPGNQVEGVAACQHQRHDAEEQRVPPSLGPAEHPHAQNRGGGEIDNVKRGFHNSLHKTQSFLAAFCAAGPL